MKLEEVIEYFGGKTKTARAVGISQPAVSQWVKVGKVPELMQYKIQVLTKNKLKAEDNV